VGFHVSISLVGLAFDLGSAAGVVTGAIGAAVTVDVGVSMS